MFERLKSNDTPLYVIAVVLLLPALLINLGKLPFFIADDEATRALVALEMIIRDKYSYSTLNGEFYYFKPPLFNWIVVGFYKLFGSTSEFVSRLPNVLGLLLFGLSIFLSLKNYYTKKQAALIALAFITSGRMLFWESFMCLIDISFSFLVFSMFMVVFYYGERQKFYKLFIYAYTLTALAFMMKGLPALVFLGITLLVYFIYRFKILALFRFSHFVGIFIFAIIVGAYYYSYWLHNPNLRVFDVLWTESTGRFTEYNVLDVIARVFMFPVEVFYHFLPWTVLLIFLLKRGLYYEFYDNKIINFCILVFFFNVIPYWTAPGFFPRYILMLMPLLYIILFDFYFRYSEKYYTRTTAMDYIVGLAMVGISVLYISLPTFEKTSHYPFIWFVCILFFIITAFILFTFIRLPKSRLIILVIALLTFRIIFGLYLWPLRLNSMKEYKNDAMMIAELTTNEDVEILFWKNLHHGLSFYITQEKWQILPINRTGKNVVTDKFYIIDEKNLREMEKGGFEFDEYMKFKPMDEWQNVFLVKFTDMGTLPENIYIKR